MSHLRVPPRGKPQNLNSEQFSKEPQKVSEKTELDEASRHGYGFISCEEVHRCLASHWSCRTPKKWLQRVISHVQDLRIYGRDTYVPQVRECEMLHVR